MKGKSGLKSLFRRDFAHIKSVSFLGLIEETEVEDLLKLDGENQSSPSG